MAMHISETPSNWNDLPRLSDTDELSDNDRECLREMMNVLIKHGRANRFGVSLLHSHFPLAEDEFLLEENDPKSRTLTIRPMSRTDHPSTAIRPTSWRWDKGEIRPFGMCGTAYGGGSCGYPDD